MKRKLSAASRSFDTPGETETIFKNGFIQIVSSTTCFLQVYEKFEENILKLLTYIRLYVFLLV